MTGGPGQFELNGGWRRLAALLAAVAWVFAVTVCPEVPEAVAAATQPTIHGNHGQGAEHSDHHADCHRAAHASAVLHFAKAARTGGAFVASAPPGAAVTQPVPAAPANPVVAVARCRDDRSRPRNTRYVAFWPHAPPLTL